MSNRAKSGNHGMSIAGNNNHVTKIDHQTNIHFQDAPKTLSKSFLFDICKCIAESDIEYDDDYSIRDNVDWNYKLEYNEVNLYIDLFDEYCIGYEDMEKVLRNFEKRDDILKKIRAIYLKKEIGQSKVSSDELLDLVFTEIKLHCVQICSATSENDFSDEELDEAIYLVMFYAITKCKLLKVPPKDGEDNDHK